MSTYIKNSANLPIVDNLSGPTVGVGEYKKDRNTFTGTSCHFRLPQQYKYDSVDLIKLDGNNTSSKDFTKHRGILDESQNHYKVKQRGDNIDVYFRSVGIYMLIFNLSMNGHIYTHTIDVLRVIGSNNNKFIKSNNKLGVKTKPRQKAKTHKNPKRTSKPNPNSAKRTQRGEQETPEFDQETNKIMQEPNEVFENISHKLVAKNANPVSNKPNPISEKVQLYENITGHGAPTKTVAESVIVNINIFEKSLNKNNNNDFISPPVKLQHQKSAASNENLEDYHNFEFDINYPKSCHIGLTEQVDSDNGAMWLDDVFYNLILINPK